MATNRGHARERQVKRLLEADGWWVARAAGSLGDADLVALRHQSVWMHDDDMKRVPVPMAEARLIEVKSTAGGPYERFGPSERRRLLEAAERAGASAWLAYWPSRGALVWIPASEWPS